MRTYLTSLFVCLSPSLFALACGGSAPQTVAPVQQQTPEDEILAIGTVWEARSQDSGLRSEPSKISVFTVHELNRLEFTPGEVMAKQSVVIQEDLRMRDGRVFQCNSDGALQVHVRFFRKADEPAVQVTRPAVQLPRHCDQPGFPEPMLQLPEEKSSFRMRSERLTGFDPPLENRSYIPMQ